jgi:hypothetical protein
MPPSNDDEFSFWTSQFEGLYPREVVKGWISHALACSAPSIIPLTMTFEDWLLKSPNFANNTLGSNIELVMWRKICPILGIVPDRAENRLRERMVKRIESERAHINGMLSLPFVVAAIFEVIRAGCRHKLEKRRPQSQGSVAPFVVGPVQHSVFTDTQCFHCDYQADSSDLIDDYSNPMNDYSNLMDDYGNHGDYFHV